MSNSLNFNIGGKSYSRYRFFNLLKKISNPRLKSFLIRKFGRIPMFRFCTLDVSGIKIPLDLTMPSESPYFIHECIEHEIGLEYILSLLIDSNTVFYDVGANIGYYSFKFSNVARKIYSFEPNPYLVNKITTIIEQNKIQNIKLYPIALSNVKDKLKLKIQFENHALSTFLDLDQKSYIETEVAVETLDNIISENNCENPTLIKVDVEGFEYNVLKGYKLMYEAKPIIIVEWLDKYVNQLSLNFEKLFEIFATQEWVIYRIESNGTLKEIYSEDEKTTSDLLICHKDNQKLDIIKKLIYKISE